MMNAERKAEWLIQKMSQLTSRVNIIETSKYQRSAINENEKNSLGRVVVIVNVFTPDLMAPIIADRTTLALLYGCALSTNRLETNSRRIQPAAENRSQHSLEVKRYEEQNTSSSAYWIVVARKVPGYPVYTRSTGKATLLILHVPVPGTRYQRPATGTRFSE